MRHFIDFYKNHLATNGKDWLVLGKGPSFAKRNQYDLSKYNTLALNHVARELTVDITHIIDIEVLEASGDSIEKNSRFLVLPWIPHFGMKSGSKDLNELLEHSEILQKLESEQRLLWYDLSTATKQNGLPDPISVRYFSAEAAIGLLAASGAKRIFSLGIDGGTAYSREFEDIAAQTKLANGQQSFDIQFAEIKKLLKTYDIEYAPLDLPPIYVGATAAEWLPFKTLEYSIRKNASISVHCHPLSEATIQIPEPKDSAMRGRTPFSFQRFLIPELTGFQGKAIYLDSDMIVMKDIQAIAGQSMDNLDVICIHPTEEEQRDSMFAVMMLNCERLQVKVADLITALDNGTLTYEAIVHRMEFAANVSQTLPSSWNDLDRYRPGVTSLIHYTDRKRQPWLTRDNPTADIWISHLREAIEAKYITMEQVKEQVARGYVRPSLMRQVELGIDEPFRLDESALKLDMDFIPPHLRQPEQAKVPWGGMFNLFRRKKSPIN